MDYTSYTTLKNKFVGHPNLCDLFKLLSIDTWKRIEYAYLKSGVKVYETTITQNLIFTINAYNDQYKLNIDVFEALDEATNGNDLELIIKYPKERLEFYAPIQAKKVNRSGYYSSIVKDSQVISLMSYAKAQKAVPLYLLYNFAPDPLLNGKKFGSPVELYGCTIVSADHIFSNYYQKRVRRNGLKDWLTPHFYQIHPSFGFCWHKLVCPESAVDLYQSLNSKGVTETAFIEYPDDFFDYGPVSGFYPLGTFSSNPKWINIKLLYVDNKNYDKPFRSSVHDVHISNHNESKNTTGEVEKEKEHPHFAPKSRVVLTR